MDLTKKRKIDENEQPDSDSDSDSDSKLTPDDVRKIIESFSNDQLLAIVQNAAVLHLDVLDAVRSIADLDHGRRKLFIRGLGGETTSEKLQAIFSTYGDMDEAVAILDKPTGKCKGYGFVTMRHIDGALLALKDPSKKIDGRMTTTQLSASGSQGQVGNSRLAVPPDTTNRKIYVSNVPNDMPADRLLAHFSSYGEVEDGPYGFDKLTGKSRGYALFVYKTVEAAAASLVDPIKTIDGHQLSCKMAIEPKKWNPEMGAVVAPGVGGGLQGQAGVPVEAYGNGMGMHPPPPMPGTFGGQYGGLGGSYGGFLGGPHMGHHPLNSSMVGGGPGLSSVGNQAQSSLGVSGGGYGSGLGGPYVGSHYGGAGSAVYGGLGGPGGFGGAGVGMVGSAGGFGGTGGGLVGSAGGFGGTGSGLVGSAGGFGGTGGGMVGSAGGFGGTGGGMVGSAGGFGGAGGGMVGSAGGFGGAGGGMVGSAGGFGGAGGGMVGSAGGFGGAGGGMVGSAGGFGTTGGGLGDGAGGGGLGGSGGSLGDIGSKLGGAGPGSSLYGGLPTSSAGFPSGSYPQSAHYSLSSSGYGSQNNNPAGTSPATRVPSGGMYQGGALYC